MKTENYVLMEMARESLKGKWGIAVRTYLVYVIIVGILSEIPVIGTIGTILVSSPLLLGYIIFSLSISRSEDAKFKQLFDGFNNFWKAFVTGLLVGLFTMLWTLLLIIPGLIAMYSYAMTFYILADDSSIGAMEAISRSKKMMDGNKWKLFCLGCRFLGWGLLCILTLGIGLLWLLPYIQISTTKFYDDIKLNH